MLLADIIAPIDLERNWGIHLPKLKALINLVLERTHLHLADKFRFDVGITNDCWKQLAKMRDKDLHLVVDSRVQRCQGKAMVAQITITEHVHQHRDYQRPQHVVIGAARV